MRKFNNIVICVPTVSQTMMSSTAITIANVVKALQKANVEADLHNIDSCEIVTARDMFANMLLHSSRWDGMLFIDSDMAFDPRLVLKLLARNEDVTAAACPRRKLDLGQLVSSASADGNLDRALAKASEFTVKFEWKAGKSPPPKPRKGFVPAAAVGMAIALISRQALIDMTQAGVVDVRGDLRTGDGKSCWSFFKVIEVDGHRYGEDYSFCHRWTAQMGRSISVCVDESVSHIGAFSYKARYSDLL